MFLRTSAIGYFRIASANIGQIFYSAKLLQKKIKKIIFAPMKRFLKILVIALFTLSYGVLTAQIKFEQISHDFGAIAEEGGSVECIFTFRNTLSKPVVIVSAESSCGCTKAEFSRKPVMPGEKSSIKVVFNPMNYPGPFARKISIVTSEGALKENLLITGKVTPRKLSVDEKYPLMLCEGVRVGANAHSFGYVEHGKMVQSTFEVYNGSTRTVTLSIANPYPELQFFLPEKLAPGKEAVINFSCLLPENSTVYGSLAYAVSLMVNGRKAQYPFIINGLAIDSREQNANNRAQMIVISENFIKFGAVKCDVVKLVREIEVRNTGNKAIIIRKLESTDKGFVAKIEGNSTIEPGGKRKIKVTIYPSQLPFGAVVERLRIISNDAKMPVITIRVSAIVEG